MKNFSDFESRYIPEPNSGCWLWLARVLKNGYGTMPTGKRGNGGYAHRFSYEKHVGPIPNGMHVLHRCDNRQCVNPDHLFVGTNLDNILDRVQKGRSSRDHGMKGVAHHMAKLSDDDIREIRKSADTGRSLAKKYNVTPTSISQIRLRQAWRHI